MYDACDKFLGIFVWYVKECNVCVVRDADWSTRSAERFLSHASVVGNLELHIVFALFSRIEGFNCF